MRALIEYSITMKIAGSIVPLIAGFTTPKSFVS